MKPNHTQARPRDSRDRIAAAVRWLREFSPGDGHGKVGEQADDDTSLFGRDVVVEAFVAGMDHRMALAVMGGDDAARTAQRLWQQSRGIPMQREDCIRAANVVEFLWNDMGEARRLVQDAVCLFRMYGVNHREMAERIGRSDPVKAVAYRGEVDKAVRNEAMAGRLERWLNGDPDNPAEVLRKISDSLSDLTPPVVEEPEPFGYFSPYPVVPDLTEMRCFECGDRATQCDACLEAERGWRALGWAAQNNLEQQTEVEDGGVERVVFGERCYRPDDAHPGVQVDTLDGVTSRERAEALRRRYTARADAVLLDVPCRYAPNDDEFPVYDAKRAEDCAARWRTGEFRGFPPAPAAKAPWTVTTGDPAFDPRQPVMINGYRFTPAKEAQ